jgi:hypothetical protein
MSRRRSGVCGAPGPHDAHCTGYPGHRYSCYDASEDVSFNDRQDWLSAHDCGDALCPDIGYRAEGD